MTSFLSTATVNAVIARHPTTVAVFNAHGIDACCGGAVPVREAALRDGADPDALLADLRAHAPSAEAAAIDGPAVARVAAIESAGATGAGVGA